MEDRYSFKTLFVQISEQKGDFWRTNLYGIVTTLLLLPVPVLVPLLIDEILLNHPGRMTRTINRVLETPPVWAYIVIILTLILLLRLLAFISNNRKTYYAIKISQSVSRRLRHHILSHLEKVSLSEYETLKSGGIAAKTVQDVESVSGFAGQVVTTVLSSSLMLAGVAIIMLKMNWILALLVFLLNPPFLGFSRILGRKTGELFRRQHEAYQLYHELLNETLELFIQVRAGNQERSFFGLLRKRAADIEQASLNYGYRAQLANSSSA
ncbi:MAG: ABC transporter ATP-binding protein, partial [Deltaproteobacteria bacterium]|nr:ABC transporter ATP-binding protein [Deltaproteobacteria bacterium]